MEKLLTLSELLDLTPDQTELVEAAGYMRPMDLVKFDESSLRSELEQAKRFLSLAGDVPPAELLGQWIAKCCEFSDLSGPQKSAPSFQGGEESLPEAIYLDKNELRLAKVGPAAFQRSQEEEDGPLSQSSRRSQAERSQAAPVSEAKIDATRVRSMEEYAQGKVAVQPLDRGEVDKRVRTKESTNRGRSQESRFYVRGVLHPRGLKVWLASVVTLGIFLLFPLSVAATTGLFLLPDRFDYLKPYLMVAPGLLLVFSVLYLFVSYRVKCCVCSQRILVPKNCVKNKKAHRLPLLGYVVPIALHTVLFHWHRCTYCGTTVRTKE